MGLAQVKTPSSFIDNSSNFSFLQMFKSPTKHSLQSVAYFNNDNQNITSPYTSNKIPQFPHSISQNRMIEIEEYKGFSLSEWGEIAVSYYKKNTGFYYNLKYLLLNKHSENKNYPEPYLAICFELELEGSGNSKEAAIENLSNLLEIYFNKTREICQNSKEFLDIIKDNKVKQNNWKQSFDQIYKRAQLLEITNKDYSHQII